MTRIALLGAGAMGSRIAGHWLKAGHEVTVYNRSPERLDTLKALGASTAPTPKAAAEGAEIIVAMVRDDQASKAVWDGAEGALQSLTQDKIAVESSTLSPGWVQALASRVEERGGAFLEAPVLGTRPQAEAAKLIYLIGGNPAALETARPILECASGAIHHMGGPGQAAAMKLAVNAQYGVQVVIWAETLALLARNGIPKTRAVEVLNTLPTTSPALQVAGNLMVEEKFAPMFPIDLVEKDFAYAEQVAKGLGLDAALIKAAHSTYERAKREGFGDDNIVAVARLFE